jgi:hypothetical protein
MKTAVVFAVDAGTDQGFVWKWRAADNKEQSAATFTYFYECVNDARQAGYTVELSGTSAKAVDGSDHRGLS